MLKESKKSTFRRVGKLCLFGFGLFVASCKQEPVNPQTPVNTETVIPAENTTMKPRNVNDDRPPKDVGGGGNRSGSPHCPGDSIRPNASRPPKDIGGGSQVI